MNYSLEVSPASPCPDGKSDRGFLLLKGLVSTMSGKGVGIRITDNADTRDENKLF